MACLKTSMESGYSPFRRLYSEWLVHRQHQHQHQHRHQGQHRSPACRITGPPLGFLDWKFAFQPHSQGSPRGPYFEKRYSGASELPEGLKNSGGFRTKQKCRFSPYSQIPQCWVCLRICFWYILESCWCLRGHSERRVAHQPLKGGRAQNHLETLEGFKVNI